MMERFSPTPDLWKKLSLFDRTVGAIAIILIGLIAVVLLRGNQSPLSVTQYSWRNTNIGAQTQALTMTFNHPVDPGKIEAGLTIDPPLAGKTVWQGRRWFYSLTEIPRYGTNYQLSLPLPSMVRGQGKRDFTSVITSRARALVYIGVGGEERGRLILYNITNPQQPQKSSSPPRTSPFVNFKFIPKAIAWFLPPLTPPAGVDNRIFLLSPPASIISTPKPRFYRESWNGFGKVRITIISALPWPPMAAC
ncbi:hypothetical protein [Synechocystis salina]|uniref:hypothetical protein n=1 Tax=Synechocystis salina TaxID=945780 RepID=UPI001D140BCC|nr:hypothetical protein [Synechocystis salina]